MTTTVYASPLEQIGRPPMREAEPCTLIIFGATGDLTRRKLLPALYELQVAGGMNGHCEIIGTGRTPLSDVQFRERVRTAFAESKEPIDTNDPRFAALYQEVSP